MSQNYIIENGILEKYLGADLYVEIPEGVEVIGKRAFQKKSSLENITFPSTLKEIGAEAFYGCNNLKSIVIPEGVEKIEDSAFSENVSLENITFPSTLKSIGKYTFYRCKSLKKAIIPEGIKLLENQTFYMNSSLETVVLPSTLKKIGHSTFFGCKKLEELNFPKGLKKIGAYAFQMSGLQEVFLPDTVESIGGAAFRAMQNLVAIKLSAAMDKYPAAIDEYGHYLSYDFLDSNDQLVEIVAQGIALKAFPNSQRKKQAVLGFARAYNKGIVYAEDVKTEYLKYIKSQRKSLLDLALSSIDLLQVMREQKVFDKKDLDIITAKIEFIEDVEIKALALDIVNSIQSKKNNKVSSESAFSLDDSDMLDSVKKDFLVKKHNKYDEFMRNHYYVTKYKGVDSVVTFPYADSEGNVISGIYSRTGFPTNYELIETVIIPEGYEIIGARAFKDCKKLKSVILPSTISVIGDECFSGCENLTTITLPEKIETLGKWTFRDCGLTRVEIKNARITIDPSDFRGCDSLKEIHVSERAIINNLKIMNSNGCGRREISIIKDLV